MNEMLHLLYIASSLTWFVILGYVFTKFTFNMVLPTLFFGVQYVPSGRGEITKIVEFADVKPGERAADLGAGDGRVVMALAKEGVEAHGYEINPVLVFKANQAIHEAGLKERAFMHCGNL